MCLSVDTVVFVCVGVCLRAMPASKCVCVCVGVGVPMRVSMIVCRRVYVCLYVCVLVYIRVCSSEDGIQTDMLWTGVRGAHASTCLQTCKGHARDKVDPSVTVTRGKRLATN